jgi:DNA-binding transcriptional ArsR family regulator
MVEYVQDELNRAFAAVADPTRRALLEALSRKSARVNELARPFPVSLNAISKHLRVLERAGLINRKIAGREHYCRLQAGPLREAAAWLEHYRQFWEVRLDALEQYLTRKPQSPPKEKMPHAKRSAANPQSRHSQSHSRSPRGRVRRLD